MRFTMYSGYSAMLKREGAEAAADYALKMGFSSVEVLELAGEDAPTIIPDVKTAEHVKKTLAERGLATACYSVCADIYKNPEAVRSLFRQAEIAAALDCPFLHHTLITSLCAKPGLPPFDEAIADVAKSAAKIAEFAKRLGVRCIYEDQGLYANGVDGFGAFYRQVKQMSGNVGVCGDVGNTLFVDEMPEKFFAAYAKDICHVHIKDYLKKTVPQSPGMYWLPTRGGSWVRDTTVGSGVVDFEACMRILKDAGYKGCYALELEHPEPYDDGVRQAMAYLERWA